MSKNKNLFLLALKGIIYIYLPVILLLFIVYNFILERNLILPWDRMLIYLAIVGIWTMRNYIHKSIELDVKDFISLEQSIIKGRWKIVKRDENGFLVKPKFDFPFRLFIDDIVEINYSEGKALIQGPWFYVNNLMRDIKGKSSIWIKKSTGIAAFVLIILLVSISIFDDLGLYWEINKIRHNNHVKNVKVVEINPDKVLGNSIENTNNYGFAVESDEYIFYIRDHFNLIRATKDFQNKKYLIEKSGGTNIMRLNIAGGWIYYSSGETLNRISVDGRDNETIYKWSYLSDIHMKDNWIYFINYSDKFNVYKMDINGRNLERFLKVNTSDIAIYSDRMIFSHRIDGEGYVESIRLDGSDRRLEFEDIAENLIKWEDYYYYIGDRYKLYRRSVDENTGPQILVDDKVSSYIIVDNKIFYSLHSDDVGYPGKGVYKIELDGTGKTLIMDTDRVGGFAKVGEWLLFHSSDNQLSPILKRLNILTDKIEIIE